MQGIRNWRTTIVGSALAMLTYWQGVGWKFPETRQDVAALAGCFLIAMFGALAKDGATGSAPPSLTGE